MPWKRTVASEAQLDRFARRFEGTLFMRCKTTVSVYEHGKAGGPALVFTIDPETDRPTVEATKGLKHNCHVLRFERRDKPHEVAIFPMARYFDALDWLTKLGIPGAAAQAFLLTSGRYDLGPFAGIGGWILQGAVLVSLTDNFDRAMFELGKGASRG